MLVMGIEGVGGSSIVSGSEEGGENNNNNNVNELSEAIFNQPISGVTEGEATAMTWIRPTQGSYSSPVYSSVLYTDPNTGLQLTLEDVVNQLVADGFSRSMALGLFYRNPRSGAVASGYQERTYITRIETILGSGIENVSIDYLQGLSTDQLYQWMGYIFASDIPADLTQPTLDNILSLIMQKTGDSSESILTHFANMGGFDGVGIPSDDSNSSLSVSYIPWPDSRPRILPGSNNSVNWYRVKITRTVSASGNPPSYDMDLANTGFVQFMLSQYFSYPDPTQPGFLSSGNTAKLDALSNEDLNLIDRATSFL